jgi:hypothetical protein
VPASPGQQDTRDTEDRALTRRLDHLSGDRLFDDFLSQSGYQKLEGWARWKINQVSELPGGHPYKTLPPFQ